MQQFVHNGQDAPEVRGPRGTLELGAEFARIHRHQRGPHVHVVGCGHVDSVHPEPLTQIEVGVHRPGIPVQVLVRPELHGVDEDGHRDVIVEVPGSADEISMSFVQRTHRHHDSPAGVPGVRREVGARVDDPHGLPPSALSSPSAAAGRSSPCARARSAVSLASAM